MPTFGDSRERMRSESVWFGERESADSITVPDTIGLAVAPPGRRSTPPRTE